MLVSLVRLISSFDQLNVDDFVISTTIERMLRFILSIKSFVQAGSNFNKNCLLIAGNLMIKTDEIKVSSKYVKFLSSLCGHRDFEIRAISWSILTKISTTLSGAEQLINGKINAIYF